MMKSLCLSHDSADIENKLIVMQLGNKNVDIFYVTNAETKPGTHSCTVIRTSSKIKPHSIHQTMYSGLK